MHPRPGRLGTALLIAAAGWYLPFSAMNTVLLPARLDQLDPVGRTADLGTIAAAAAVTALVANVAFGFASDRTRSRFGRRSPWIVGGAIGAAAATVGASTAASPVELGVWWCVFSVALNAHLAALVAVIADRVPRRSRGTVSALYGSGLIVGQALGSAVGARYLTEPATGMRVVPLLFVVAALVFVILVRERGASSYPDRPRELRRSLAPLADHDFVWVLVGRLLMLMAVAMVLGFQLFVLTDHIGLDVVGAQGVLVVAGLLIGVCALASGLLFGVLSDRVGRRRVPVLIAAASVAAGAVVVALAPSVAGFLVFVGLAAFGYGAYQSVDTALMTEVLPSAHDRARDLGILNVANAGGQALGPGLVAVLLAAGLGWPGVFVATAAAAALSGLAVLPVRSAR